MGNRLYDTDLERDVFRITNRLKTTNSTSTWRSSVVQNIKKLETWFYTNVRASFDFVTKYSLQPTAQYWFVWFLFYLNHSQNHPIGINLVMYAFKCQLVEFLSLPELHDIYYYNRINLQDEQYQFVVYYLLKYCPTFVMSFRSYSSRRRDEICSILQSYESKILATIQQSLKCIDLSKTVVEYM